MLELAVHKQVVVGNSTEVEQAKCPTEKQNQRSWAKQLIHRWFQTGIVQAKTEKRKLKVVQVKLQALMVLLLEQIEQIDVVVMLQESWTVSKKAQRIVERISSKIVVSRVLRLFEGAASKMKRGALFSGESAEMVLLADVSSSSGVD